MAHPLLVDEDRGGEAARGVHIERLAGMKFWTSVM
jgi:hypothetical protein